MERLEIALQLIKTVNYSEFSSEEKEMIYSAIDILEDLMNKKIDKYVYFKIDYFKAYFCRGMKI